MAKRAGVDDLFKSQPAPARWGMTYRARRRNSRRIYNKGQMGIGLIWGEAFYSERHFSSFPHAKPL